MIGCFSHFFFSFFCGKEYLAAAELKEICLKHDGPQKLLSESEIGDFLKRTNVKNFVVRFWPCMTHDHFEINVVFLSLVRCHF